MTFHKLRGKHNKPIKSFPTSRKSSPPISEEEGARQYLEYTRLLSKVLWNSALFTIALGFFAAYLALLPLIFGSSGTVVRFGDLNEEMCLTVLGIIAAVGIGLQVAVRSPTADDPLEQGRREWLGRFSLVITAAAMSVSLYLFAQVMIFGQNNQGLLGEHLGILFLGFGISCIPADAAVAVERTASKQEYREAWNKLSRENIQKALNAVTDSRQGTSRWSYPARRLSLWAASPLVLILAWFIDGSHDLVAIIMLTMVGLTTSLSWYYFSAYTLKSRLLGNYFDMTMAIIIGFLLGSLLLISLWFSLVGPNSDAADFIKQAMVSLWIVISPGFFAFLSLRRGPRSVIFYRVKCRLEVRLNRISSNKSDNFSKSDPLAVAGFLLSVVVPVGILLAEFANINITSDDRGYSSKKTRRMILSARILTCIITSLALSLAFFIYSWNPPFQ
jgi:hypothetical protein